MLSLALFRVTTGDITKSTWTRDAYEQEFVSQMLYSFLRFGKDVKKDFLIREGPCLSLRMSGGKLPAA